MAYKIQIEREVDGRWIAEISSLPGVLAYGQTKQMAVARVKALALRVIADQIERETRSSKPENPVTTPSSFSFALR